MSKGSWGGCPACGSGDVKRKVTVSAIESGKFVENSNGRIDFEERGDPEMDDCPDIDDVGNFECEDCGEEYEEPARIHEKPKTFLRVKLVIEGFSTKKVEKGFLEEELEDTDLSYRKDIECVSSSALEEKARALQSAVAVALELAGGKTSG